MSFFSTPYLFPGCINQGMPPSPPDGLYIALSQDDFMRWNRRAKQWSLAIVASADASNSSGSNSSMGGTVADTGFSDELDLVCASQGFSGNFNDTKGPPNTSQVRASFSLDTSVGDCYFDSGTYYVLVTLTARVNASSEGSDAMFAQDLWNIDLGAGTGFTVDIDGSSYNCSLMRVTTTDPGGGATATSTLTSISLSISEYYEYDPGDGGGPVWSGSTGAQLRDPFSITTW